MSDASEEPPIEPGASAETPAQPVSDSSLDEPTLPPHAPRQPIPTREDPTIPPASRGTNTRGDTSRSHADQTHGSPASAAISAADQPTLDGPVRRQLPLRFSDN